MDLAGGLLSEFVFVAVSILLMQLALRRRREGGPFAALSLGAIPALAMSGLLFWQLQQRDDPDVKSARAAMAASIDSVAQTRFPKPDDADQRRQLKEMGASLFEMAPAAELTLRLILLAALALLLRRRRSRAGLAVEAGPLSRWSAPWWLAWVVLVPVFWLLAGRQGLVEPPDWSQHLAWNALFVGVAIQLFHGSVVLYGKLLLWWRGPSTRALSLLAPSIAFAGTLALGDLRPLLVFITLNGLFEPWLDLRRVNHPPTKQRLDQGGGV